MSFTAVFKDSLQNELSTFIALTDTFIPHVGD